MNRRIQEWVDHVTRKARLERHDYEPGDTTSPMSTDPYCRICGLLKRENVHR